MRTLDHYLSTIADTDTVGPEYLAEAIYVARQGPAHLSKPGPDDLRPIIEDLDDDTDSGPATKRVAAAALRRAATSDDATEFGAIMSAVREHVFDSRADFGAALGLPVQDDGRRRRCSTLERWERGDSMPTDWRRRQAIEELADDLEI